MFTGLIEEVGSVLRLTKVAHGAHLHVRATTVLEETRIGDSIAVNGACLTVVTMNGGSFAVDCMPETLEHTTIGSLHSGDAVNLERAMMLGDRLGGHLVLGHVDAVGEVLSVKVRSNAWEIRITLPPTLRGFVAPKGSITVDGISLTVTDVTDHDFGLGIIPHTLGVTTLATVKAGRLVNLEADVLARYVKQAMETMSQQAADSGEMATPPAASAPTETSSRSGLTEAILRDYGF